VSSTAASRETCLHHLAVLVGLQIGSQFLERLDGRRIVRTGTFRCRRRKRMSWRGSSLRTSPSVKAPEGLADSPCSLPAHSAWHNQPPPQRTPRPPSTQQRISQQSPHRSGSVFGSGPAARGLLRKRSSSSSPLRCRASTDHGIVLAIGFLSLSQLPLRHGQERGVESHARVSKQVRRPLGAPSTAACQFPGR